MIWFAWWCFFYLTRPIHCYFCRIEFRCLSARRSIIILDANEKKWNNEKKKKQSHKTISCSLFGLYMAQKLKQTKKNMNKANSKWLKVLRWIFSSNNLNIMAMVSNWHKIPVWCSRRKQIRISRRYRNESSQLNQFNAIYLIGFDDRTSFNFIELKKR